MVKILVEKTVKAFGDIDILILNAGPEVPWKPFTELTQEEFEAKLVGEMRSFFLPAKAIVPAMIKRGSGSIVGVSSGLSRYYHLPKKPGLSVRIHQDQSQPGPDRQY